MSREVQHFIYQKTQHAWAPYEQAKRIRKIFRFREDIRKKRVSTKSLTTPTHGNLFTLEKVKN